MGVDDQHSEVNPPSPFVEVRCTISGKTRCFAVGTEAYYAALVINSKLEGESRSCHIEAMKDGEEPITFGPTCVLVEYGDGWRLQTVFDSEGLKKERESFVPWTRPPPLMAVNVSPPVKLNISFLYIAKIFLAFVLLFAMGAVLTFALENLPRLILYINSSSSSL